MPCKAGLAWPSSVCDAAMMRAFRHECGILCAILTGLMESTHHTRLILDPSSRSSLHCSILDHFHQHIWAVGFPYPGTARNRQPASGGAAMRRSGTRGLHIEPRSPGAATRSCCACAALRAGMALAARHPSRQARELGLWEFSAKAGCMNLGSGLYSEEYSIFSEPIPTAMLSRLTLLNCHKRYLGASKRAQIW